MTPTEPDDPTGLPRRNLVALVGAALALVAVVALVLAFGVARPPALTPLTEDPTPAPPGGVAWMGWGDGEECLHVASADGTARELRCPRDGGSEILGWDEDGITLLVRGPAQELIVVDPVTGEVEERRDLSEDREPRPPRSGDIDSRYEDGVLTVRHTDEDVVLWSVEAPENYRIDQGSTSPDGDWVVLLDGVGRLLLVPVDGSAAPRVWADTDSGWQVPVWEGTPVDDAAG
ncbi:MAG: hypothetical protein WD638_08970 [Nitriliruptoraceae bacterium]